MRNLNNSPTPYSLYKRRGLEGDTKRGEALKWSSDGLVVPAAKGLIFPMAYSYIDFKALGYFVLVKYILF